MRHYCNRQNPDNRKKSESNDDKNYIQSQIPLQVVPANRNEEQEREEEDAELIFPPSSNFNLNNMTEPLYEGNMYDLSSFESEAQGGAVSQRGGFVKQLNENTRNDFLTDRNYEYEVCGEACRLVEPIRFNDMSGKGGVISLPMREPQSVTMQAYLSKYKGKYICLDLWSSDGRRVEKCGMLLEIGDDFLVVRKGCTGEITMIDLKTIRYISIYCR